MERGKKFWSEQSITEWMNRQSTPVITMQPNVSPAKRLKQAAAAFEERQESARQTLARHAAGRKRQHNS
jgi:hypothetical protein